MENSLMISPSNKKTIIILGAGPAGLTAGAYLSEEGYKITILEKDPIYVGGISRTVKNNGYRFDIGGHRFFSKSDEVTNWWKNRLPKEDFISVKRLSRIFYKGTYFDYPLKTTNALFGLGVFTSFLCFLSYIKVRISPITPEKSFEDWVTNRFGKKLFNIFFKTYTEKVWGMPCNEISADWAAQRIKGLSLLNAVLAAVLPKGKPKAGKDVIKTLIDTFEYPRLGPGMMWEKTRDDIIASGNEIKMGEEVISINRSVEENKIISITTKGLISDKNYSADEFICSIPLKEAVLKMNPPLSSEAQNAAKSLTYRDFLTVALVVNKTNIFPDNWIYIHDPSVKLGRIQNFNNWSKEMIPNSNTTCLGLEYFCFEGDDIWSKSDNNLIELAKEEVEKLKLVRKEEVLEGYIVKMPKAYPVYNENYQKNIDIIKKELNKIKNFQPVGRNGMHKYNNQDHSMMTAILAAKNIQGEKFNLWKVNTDAEYNEGSK